ncbi:MAG: hypothetical protein JKY54_08530 [Flavobacteriales bacterium]|nr:hypothetical protein [Flavobacteriales bacterium]
MRTFLFAFTLLLLVTSCGEPEDTIVQIEINENDLINIPILEESDDFVFIPPSPIEIARYFKSAGLSYDIEKLNAVSNRDKYHTKFKKALNFGIYSADLATCVLHDRIGDAQSYLEVIESLADDIGMSSIFSGDIVGKFKRNMDNSDSIQELLDDMQYNTMTYIEVNGEDDLEAIYYAGAWMEGMYLGALTLKEQDPEKIVQKLSSQIELGNKIARGLEKIEDQDPEIKDVRYSILQIVNEYNTFESVINLTMEDIDFGRIHLTQPELKAISGLIIDLRTEMIR